jgi:hypothetical protein
MDGGKNDGCQVMSKDHMAFENPFLKQATMEFSAYFFIILISLLY